MAQLSAELKPHLQTIYKRLLTAAQENRLAPVQLFSGPSSADKKSVALALAQALVCEASLGCGKCGPCIRVAKGSSESVFVVEPDGTQIKIEQTREIQNHLSLQQMGRARIIILNEAQRLNVQAANSLLKTLEEPPTQTYFIFIAPSQASLLPTLRSRSQMVRFGVSRLLSETETSEEVELRRQAHGFFLSLPDRARRNWAYDQIKELALDREGALRVVSLWMRFLRDQALARNHQSRSYYPELEWSLFPNLSSQATESLYQLLSQAERDLQGNVDRTLVLEILWQKSHEAIANPRH